MATPLQCNFVGLIDSLGAPAVAALGPNTRVSASCGVLATAADVVQFPGAIGNWLVPATRCLVGGVPAIIATSGSLVTQMPPPVPSPVPIGPMVVSSPDPRAQGT